MVQTCNILLLSLITTLFSPIFTFITKGSQFFSAVYLTTIDFEIKDLQGNGADFLADASYWQFTGLLGDATNMICNETYLLAGYRILGNTSSIQRIYDIPQPHNSVFISFSLWIMSSWTDSNTITVIISDGATEFFNQNVLATDFTGRVGFSSQKTKCNGTLDLMSLPITIQTSHTGNQLYFTIQTNMQAIPYNQSFGFRNLNLTISTQTIATPSFCVANTLGFLNLCSCPLGDFKSGKKCYVCDSTCSQCLGNGSTKCSMCAPNYYYNGAFCINCDPSCTTCSGPGVNSCLTCPAGSYLYSTGKCLPDCPAPFITRVSNNITFCDAPCSQADFFYANNNTCQPECPSPYTTGIIENGQFCDCPSASLEKYQVCLSQSQFEFVQTVDTIRDGAQTAASVLLVASSVISIGNPRVFLFSTISKMLQYIKYLDINYTPRLQVILNNWNSTMLSIDTGINVPRAAQKVTEYDSPPFVFARFDMKPSFIMNYWDGLLCLVILLAVLTFTIVKEYLAKHLNKNQNIYPWFKKLRLTMQNFLVIYFYEQFGDVVFASVINFESLKPGAAFSSFSCSISTITSAVLLLSGVIIFGIYIRLIYQHQRNKKMSVKPGESESEKSIPLQEKYEGAQVLFRDFNDMSALQQGILLIYILRESTFYIILTTLYDHPFVQMILLVIISIAAIIYLILKSPFKEKFETVEHASFEGILLTANIILLTLSVLDMKKAEAWLVREILCFIVLMIIVILNFVLLGFFAVKGVLLLKKACKAWKKKRNSQQDVVKVWPNIPLKVLQKKRKLVQIKHFNSDFEADSENEKRLTADLEKDKTWNSPTSNSISSTRNLEDAFTALSISTFKRIRNRNLRRREREGTIFRGDPIENLQLNQDSHIK